MTYQSKKEYLRVLQERYKSCTNRQEKTALINETVENLGLVRKSAIRALNRKQLIHRKPRRGRKETYGYDLIRPLKQLWLVAGKPCSKRLKPQVAELINRLKAFDEIELFGEQEVLLRRMSTFTIDKLLTFEKGNPLKDPALSGTKKSPLLKTLIPIRTNFKDVSEPGHVEMDCVLHCGDSLSGIYAETFNVLDILTHWNEKKIFLKKTKYKVIGAFHMLRPQFPFPIKSIDFDNGGEFVNWQMHGYCKREKIDFTRSRSNHKNDQAYIESKNYQSVRKVTGYERITEPKLVKLMDDLYQNEHRLLTNFFYTTMKLKSKKRDGAKVSKTYEAAKTPYQRVLECDTISQEIKDGLTKEYLSLNPAKLQRDYLSKIQKIRSLMGNTFKSGNAR
jgi:hypothetical protein